MCQAGTIQHLAYSKKIDSMNTGEPRKRAELYGVRDCEHPIVLGLVYGAAWCTVCVGVVLC